MNTLVSVAVVIGALAEVVIAVMLAAALYYLIGILRRARDLTERVQEEGEELLEDIEEARERSEEGASTLAKGAGLAAEIIADLATGESTKKRPKPK